MAEKCISTIDDTSLNLKQSELLQQHGHDSHHILYDDNTPLISLNNSTSDLSTVRTVIKVDSVVMLEDDDDVVVSVNDDDDDDDDETVGIIDEQKLDVFLETPVIDEQEQQNNLDLTATNIDLAKPKRLSDEFFSADDGDCDDEDDNGNDDITPSASSTSNSLIQHDNNNVVALDEDVDVDDDDDDVGLVEDEVGVDDDHPIIFDDNDVQSMDAIERRDYEQEQKLTGGVIVRNRSIINNCDNRLNLGLINNNKNKTNEDTVKRSDTEDKVRTKCLVI